MNKAGKEKMWKRRKVLRCSSCSALEEVQIIDNINDMPDELLVEIFCRLPCSRVAIQCKCVSKHWAVLISHPDFISRFIASKMEESTSTVDAFVARIKNYAAKTKGDTWKGFMMQFKDPVSNLQNFSLSSLPFSVDGNATPTLTVVGSFNDLLLYCRDEPMSESESDKYDYYIYNVQTKHWVLIPSPPFPRGKYQLTGFMCEPYYYSYKGGGDNIILNAAYRYSIIVVPFAKPSLKFTVHMFSSNTGQWTDIVLSFPTRFQLVMIGDSCGFVYSTMLHFNCSEGIVGFDPYDGAVVDGDVVRVVKCHVIGYPAHPFGFLSTEVCQGLLHLYNIRTNGELYIWVLKDYWKSEWSLQHRMETQEWVPRDSRLTGYIQKHGRLRLYVLGRHPTNPDIVYLLNHRSIVLCNASTRTMQVVARTHKISNKLYAFFYKFRLMLPLWPTPTPTLV